MVYNDSSEGGNGSGNGGYHCGDDDGCGESYDGDGSNDSCNNGDLIMVHDNGGNNGGNNGAW